MDYNRSYICYVTNAEREQTKRLPNRKECEGEKKATCGNADEIPKNCKGTLKEKTE